MPLKQTPKYSDGVALTEIDGTWVVLTDFTHPDGEDAVGYPTYGDAHKAWKLSVLSVLNA